MGGDSWWFRSKRSLVDEIPTVDVRACVRVARGGRGGPRAARRTRVRSDGSWTYGLTSRATRNGAEVWSLAASLDVKGSRGSLRLRYQSGGVSHEPVIALEAEPMRFGGARWWGRCGECGRRCSRFYVRGPRVACRVCFDLAYRSTRTAADWRAWERMVAIAKRLGAGDRATAYAQMDVPPVRPARMREATYQRLVTSWRRASWCHCEAWTGALLVAAGRLEARQARRRVR